MNDTVKTILIVGGVAVGVVLLFRMIQPAGAAAPAPRANTDVVSLQSLFTIGAALGNAFGGGGGGVGQPTSGAPSVGYEPGESFDDFYTGFFGPGSTDVAGY